MQVGGKKAAAKVLVLQDALADKEQELAAMKAEAARLRTLAAARRPEADSVEEVRSPEDSVHCTGILTVFAGLLTLSS